MSQHSFTAAWLVAGIYFGIAGIGESATAAFCALACGWCAGRRSAQQGGES